MIVSIVTLILPFAFVIIVLWLQSNEKHKRYQLQAELYTKALEKGQPIPTDLFAEPRKKRNPLNTGIVCVSVGSGIALCFGLMYLLTGSDMKDDELILFRLIGSLGIIPIIIGLAFLIIHFIEKKKTASEDAQ